jgi:organic hydroperoxide reductase OsmC/OhrA
VSSADAPTDASGFTRLLLRLRLETDTANEAQARQLAEQAERTCLVSASLDLPTETIIEVKTTQPRESTIGKESSLAR